MRAGRFVLTLAAGLLSCTETAPPTALGPGPAPVMNFLHAHDYPGATLGQKIDAAVAALPATGGVVDATDFIGRQRLDHTISLGADGKPVELRLGNVTLAASVIAFVLHDRAKLIGNDLTTVTQDTGANLGALITGRGVADCEIAHLIIDGNGRANTTAASAISLSSAKRCWLHHLVVQNTVGRLNPAIVFHDEGNEDNTVEHNLVQDIGTLVDYADGIYVAGSGNKVLFNRIRRATDFGIVGEFCTGCVIYGNDIVGVPGGIAVGSGIVNHAAIANVIDGNTITGGLTTTWGMITIYRTSGATPVATVVKGNVVRNVVLGHGIFVNGAEQVSLDGNVLSNIGVTKSSYGIFIDGSRDVSVKGGVIDSTGSFGIGIGGSSNIAIDDVLITDAGRSGSEASGIGVDVGGKSSTSISLTRLHIFDSDTVTARKLMPFCVDFGQGGATAGVLISDLLFDDGVNAIGCRDGAIRLAGASRVTAH